MSMVPQIVKIKVWKEGKHVLIRNDDYHINTYGKTFKEALRNFQEAYLLNVEGEQKIKQAVSGILTLVVDLPTDSAESKSQIQVEAL